MPRRPAFCDAFGLTLRLVIQDALVDHTETKIIPPLDIVNVVGKAVDQGALPRTSSTHHHDHLLDFSGLLASPPSIVHAALDKAAFPQSGHESELVLSWLAPCGLHLSPRGWDAD